MKSLLRREEYRVLSTLVIDGEILDVGGSTKSGYHELMQGTHTITTANIDAAYGADLIFDAEKAWPIADESYDAVLFINVLEHLYDHRMALREAYRVLRPGGTLHIAVPFMFNVHGSPNDYFRYTKSALTRLLNDSGFAHAEIRALGTGGFSVMYHTALGLLRWRWLSFPILNLAVALDKAFQRIRPENSMDAEHMPLGYYAAARR
ncbi:MAG TPA: methyltransferase domain-containing protein [Candidatus Paceibacterota bacterium]|nr:methyltransferase domain-containing protein [Candidatus Paceibacterota bacterium]